MYVCNPLSSNISLYPSYVFCALLVSVMLRQVINEKRSPKRQPKHADNVVLLRGTEIYYTQTYLLRFSQVSFLFLTFHNFLHIFCFFAEIFKIKIAQDCNFLFEYIRLSCPEFRISTINPVLQIYRTNFSFFLFFRTFFTMPQEPASKKSGLQ